MQSYEDADGNKVSFLPDAEIGTPYEDQRPLWAVYTEERFWVTDCLNRKMAEKICQFLNNEL